MRTHTMGQCRRGEFALKLRYVLITLILFLFFLWDGSRINLLSSKKWSSRRGKKMDFVCFSRAGQSLKMLNWFFAHCDLSWSFLWFIYSVSICCMLHENNTNARWCFSCLTWFPIDYIHIVIGQLWMWESEHGLSFSFMPLCHCIPN